MGREGLWLEGRVLQCNGVGGGRGDRPKLYAEQMDAEGLGRKLLLAPSDDRRRTPEKRTVGSVTASQKMLNLQALSSSLNAGAAKRGCLDRGEAFGCPPVCPPERPRPFTHYRKAHLSGTKKRGFLEGGFAKCMPLLAVPLWVPNVLLGPISLGILCFLGRDTGLYRNPLC